MDGVDEVADDSEDDKEEDDDDGNDDVAFDHLILVLVLLRTWVKGWRVEENGGERDRCGVEAADFFFCVNWRAEAAG